MCLLCSERLGESHWSDPPAGDGPGRAGGEEARRTRRARRELLNALRRVLDICGLQVEDWSGRVYLLRDGKGGVAEAGHVGLVWVEAERLTGRRLDPLDGRLLEALRSRTAAAATR